MNSSCGIYSWSDGPVRTEDSCILSAAATDAECQALCAAIVNRPDVDGPGAPNLDVCTWPTTCGPNYSWGVVCTGGPGGITGHSGSCAPGFLERPYPEYRCRPRCPP